jgi:hypothetical protein
MLTTIPREEEPERFSFAHASAEVGRALLTGLAHTGMVWGPAPLLTPIIPLTRSPKTVAPEALLSDTSEVITVRPSRLRLLFQRFASAN